MGSRRIAVMERVSGTESFVEMEILAEDAAAVGELFCRVTAKTHSTSTPNLDPSAHTGIIKFNAMGYSFIAVGERSTLLPSPLSDNIIPFA